MKKLLFIFALIVIAAPRVEATIAFVQQKDQESTASGTSFTLTPTSSVGAGNELFVVVRIGDDTIHVTSPTVSGSVNGSFTQVTGFPINDSTNRRQVTLFYKENSTSGSEVLTISWTGAAAQNQASFYEYSGMATSSSLDQASSNTCPTTSANPTTSVTTTAASELLIGMVLHSSGDTVTVTTESSGFVVCAANGCLNDTEGTATHPHTHSSTQIVSSTGTFSYAPTLSSSIPSCVGIASFKASSGPAGPPVAQRPRVY